MNQGDFENHLRLSLCRQNAIFENSLILNPVENIPFARDISCAAGFLHGLYNSDKTRTNREKINTLAQFAGRDRITYDISRIYRQWAKALQASEVSMRLLSGLHAHAVIFMAIADIGDKVLLLPEVAGGHVATKTILQRLGIVVVDMVADSGNQCVDVAETITKARQQEINFIFVDRSEGLHYEDFSELLQELDVPSIFDASQYLSNIIAGDHPSPFSMGFDMIVSSLHKNFPGPQRALFATNHQHAHWGRFKTRVSTFVSNMHSFGIYSAGLTLSRRKWIKQYSRNMLNSACRLSANLKALGVNATERNPHNIPTHHVWIELDNKNSAFDCFQKLERCRILTNYRKLPYGLGYGLRLGTSAATRIGMMPSHLDDLSELIADIIKYPHSVRMKHRVRSLLNDFRRERQDAYD